MKLATAVIPPERIDRLTTAPDAAGHTATTSATGSSVRAGWWPLKSCRETADIGGMTARLGTPIERDRSVGADVLRVDFRRTRPLRRARDEDELPSWLLRIGLAFVFLYAGSAMMLNPDAFMGYIPKFVRGSLATVLLQAFAVFEFVLASALLSRRFAYLASVTTVLTLASITLMNFDSFDVLFRNVAIAFAAASLAVQLRRARPQAGRRPSRISVADPLAAGGR